ncbi:MAG: hypothetical protein UY73_C0049G0002 [Parcubacteria group bacterium GW2011_GWA2_52_8]|nr:MAG: hypothetical protein UY73_C0049G0002 [Parcubacteria group bacterium GW2011_GWA2_52_8]
MADLVTFFSRDAKKDVLVWVSFGGALLGNIILWVVLLSKFGFSREAVPLHFNVVSGIDLVDSARNLYQISSFGFLTLIVNFFLQFLLGAQEKPLRWFLAGATLAVQVLLLIAALALIFI